MSSQEQIVAFVAFVARKMTYMYLLNQKSINLLIIILYLYIIIIIYKYSP